MKGRTVFLGLALVAAGLSPAQEVAGQKVAGQDIPDRPEELVFPDFVFETPDGSDYHHELSNGIPVIVVEDRTLPLIRLGVTLRIGSFLEPADQVGLASLTATMMREGGAGDRSPEELDERIEFLAARISASSWDTEARGSLRTITPVFEESLDLFFDVLMRPRFDEARFSVRQENVREDLKQRNDDADSLLGREWDFLLYGQDHYLGRRMTSGHLDAITPDDLRDFHRRYWRPEHMVWSVSGDVDTAEILAMLEERLAAWPAADEAAAVDWPPPHEVPNPAPGIYHVEKDIPQGKVRIGNLAPRWDDWDNPERAAIQVMDHILGASGFTSRIMQRVRSDEGLAYGAGGRFGFNPLGAERLQHGLPVEEPHGGAGGCDRFGRGPSDARRSGVAGGTRACQAPASSPGGLSMRMQGGKTGDGRWWTASRGGSRARRPARASSRTTRSWSATTGTGCAGASRSRRSPPRTWWRSRRSTSVRTRW